MPAIAGTSRFSWCWLPCRIAPPAMRNSSGSRKLKKAALGLRQNIRRSRRYWRQLSVSASGVRGRPASATRGSGIGGQLQVDVLERRAPDAQLPQLLTPRERLCGQLVQESRRVLGLPFDQLSVVVEVGDAVLRAADAEL